MRILVCGDRNWTDKETIRKFLLEYNPTVVIEGEARGADSLAREVAEEEGIVVEKYPADWNTNGKAAGPIRNQQMLKKGKPDMVLAFHDNLDKSKGTKHMITIAKKSGLRVFLIKHETNLGS